MSRSLTGAGTSLARRTLIGAAAAGLAGLSAISLRAQGVTGATGATGALPAGSRRHLRFAYNGTGICTAAVPVALHRGYFEKHGLDVEFVELAGTTDQMLQALATDKADVGSAMLLNWLKPLEQGFDVKLTTGLHGGCTRLLARADSGIKDITDFRGKTIGVSSIAGTPKHFFAILLANHNVDPDTEVQWREYPADLLATALQRGEVQGMADSDPAVWLSRARSNGALVEIASNLSDYYADLSCCTLGVRGVLARDDKPTAAAVTRAIQEAEVHIVDNPDDAAQIFSQYTPKVAVSELSAMLRSHTHNHTPSGDALRTEVTRIAGDLRHAHILKPSTDPARFAQRIVADVV